MSNSNANYPTVATIIGCPEQLNSTNGLVATPIGASGELQPPTGPYIEDTSHIKDPIQKALIDNICGNIPSKNSADYIRCQVCKVDCNGNAAYKSHLSGARHSKRLKEQEMADYVNLPFIRHNKDSNTYSCTLCCATLNAVSQIGSHIEGQKHKAKAQSNEPLATSNSKINSDPAKPRVDATPNLLYCATCNIHVNSAMQLDQHTKSKKHINRVNMGSSSNFRQASWKWKSRATGRHMLSSRHDGLSPGRFMGGASYPKISHSFVPAVIHGETDSLFRRRASNTPFDYGDFRKFEHGETLSLFKRRAISPPRSYGVYGKYPKYF